MKPMVYLVYDFASGEDELVAASRSREGAQYAVYEHLVNEVCYSPEEWMEFAEDNGYDTVEEFQEYLKACSDYNEDMQMAIVTEELRD